MSPSGAFFAVERVLGYMFYIDYVENDATLSSSEITTFQNDIATALNTRAASLGYTITCAGVGYERRGNRVYWFVQVTIDNHTDIENKFKQLVQGAALPVSGNVQPQVVPAYNAPRYLPNGTEVVFNSGGLGKYFRARLWGAHGRSGGTVNTSTWVDDWLSGAGVAEFAYRVSQPLNLNIFTPCYATLRQRRKL
jgi:hypothetical protein